MAKKPVGEMVISLDLETAAYTKAQQKILAESKEAAKTINANFQRLGVTSDELYTAMSNRAELAFRKIGLSAKSSLAEVERSYAAMVASVNTTNQKMAANPLFETLGIRSVAAIKAQRDAVMASYEGIKTIGNHTAQDLINIERAKNEKLKELNKEMQGSHEMSMASMTRAVLRFYAAWYVASAAIGFVGRAFMSGVETIDKMQLSAVTVAATITNLQGTSGNVVENYKKNLEYAKALVPILMQIDAASLANLEQVQLINNALAMHGVILDSSNKKQVASMTALTNTIAIFTKGQNQSQQSIQETNAALNGEVTSRNRLALMLDQQIKRQGDYADGLKGLNAEAAKHGDWLERIAPYLVGINAAAGDISKTWEAVKTSLQTTWMILQTEIFADFYKGLVTSGQEAIGWARENAPKIGQYFKISMNAVGDAVGAVWGALKGFLPVMQDLGMLIAPIAYGWGGVLAVLKPIGEAIGNALQSTYLLGKAILDTVLAIASLSVGSVAGARIYWDAAKKGYTEVGELTKKNFNLLTSGVSDAIVAYDKQYDAMKKAAGDGYVPKVPPGGKSKEELDAIEKARKAEEDRYLHNAELIAKLQEQTNKKNEDDLKWLENLDKEQTANYLHGAELIAKLTADTNKATEDQLAWIKKNEEEKVKAVQDAAEIYRRIMISEESFDTDRKEQAMKRIIDREKEKYKIIDDLRKADLISEQQADAAKKKIVESTAAETRKLTSETFFKENADREQAFSSMASNFEKMGQLYAADSRERQVLSNLSKAATIAEIALQVEKNLMIAIGAVVNQGTGDPYSAFARIAAMVAVVAGVLSIGGIAFGGGSGGSVAPSAAYGVGTTTLGGANDSGSQSISKSWELLQDTYDMEDTKLSGIYNEMKDLNQNITGLITGIVRMGAGKFTGFDSGDILNSFGAGEFDKFVRATVGDTAGLLDERLSFGKLDIVGTWLSDNIGPAISNFLFGSTKQYASGSGIRVSAGQAGNQNITGYQRVTTESDGGLFGNFFGGGGSSTSDNAIALPQEVTDLLTKVFKGFSKTFEYLAKGFGTNATTALNYMFPAIDWNLQGKTADEIDKYINEQISLIGDTAVATLFGTLISQYQQVGEGLLQTAIRLVIEKESVLSALDMTGKAFVEGSVTAVQKSRQVISAEWQAWSDSQAGIGSGILDTIADIGIQAVGSITEPAKYITEVYTEMQTGAMAAVALTQSLIDIAGGLDALTEAASTYYDKFFTDAEKQIDRQESLTGIMENLNKEFPGGTVTFPWSGLTVEIAGLNLSLGTTRQSYRDQIQALDLTTEAGKNAYVTLMKAAGIADEYYSTIEDGLPAVLSAIELAKQQHALDIRLLEEQGRTAEVLAIRRADELAATDALLRPTLLLIYAQQDLNAANEVTKGLRSLDIQLMEAQGLTSKALAEARKDELAAMNPALRTMQLLVWAQLDKNKADAVALELLKQQKSLTIQLLTVQGRTNEAITMQRNEQLAAMDISLRKTQLEIWAEEDAAANRAHLAELEVYNTNLQIEAMQKWISTAQDYISEQQNLVDELLGFVDQLKSARESMQMEGVEYAQQQTIQAKALFAGILAQARVGDFSGMKDMDNILSTLTQSANSSAGFATLEDYKRNFYATQNSILELEGLVTNQKTVEQQTLDIMMAQLITQQGILATLQTPAAAAPPAAPPFYGNTYQPTMPTITVPSTAQSDYAAYFAQAQAGSSRQWAAGTLTMGAGGIATYVDSTGRSVNLSATSSIADLWKNNADIRQLWNSVYGNFEQYAEGGIASGPASGYMAELHGTELVVSPRTGYPATVKGDNVVLISELRALREELKSANVKNGRYIEKTAKWLEKFDNDGIAVRV